MSDTLESGCETSPVYVIEKRRGGPDDVWKFLTAFGGPLGRLEAGMWLAKPHKSKAMYRCRELTSGPDVTERLKVRK